MEIDTPTLSDTTISKSIKNKTNTSIDFEDNENILNSPLFNAKSRKSLSLGNLNSQQNLQRRFPLQESRDLNSLSANSGNNNNARNTIKSIDTANDRLVKEENNTLSKSKSQPQLVPNKSRDHLTHQRSNSLKRPLALSPKVDSPNCIGLAADFYSNFHVNHSYKDISNPKKILLTSIINNNNNNNNNTNHPVLSNNNYQQNLNNNISDNANDQQDSHDDNITSNDEESEDSDNDSQKTSDPQHSIFTNNNFSSTTLSLFPTSSTTNKTNKEC
ncbi:hypothetical protein B5S28_g3588 [[Candida] boidinii]|nr:hypothetical protein B5S28_g3588 [[Candida] boidinii]OWB62241.1 hypothetical protein B5S29_g3163 [[Candida] boidinii]